MTQDIDKSADRLIASERLAKDARRILGLVGELMPAYCGLLDSDDHAIVDGALNAITSLRKIAIQAHGMLSAGENVGNADNVDRQTAGMIVSHSTMVCRQCREQWEAEAVSAAARKAHVKRAGERKAIETESELKAQAYEKTLDYIRKHARRSPVQGRTVKQNLARKLRDYTTDALLALEKDKAIECAEHRDTPTASVWRLADGEEGE